MVTLYKVSQGFHWPVIGWCFPEKRTKILIFTVFLFEQTTYYNRSNTQPKGVISFPPFLNYNLRQMMDIFRGLYTLSMANREDKSPWHLRLFIHVIHPYSKGITVHSFLSVLYGPFYFRLTISEEVVSLISYGYMFIK